jgi:hypothetical protein
MLSCHDKDGFAVISLLIHVLGYHQSLDWPFAQSFTGYYLCDNIFEFVGSVSDEFIEFLSRVGVGVSHKKFIILKGSRKFKRKFIVHSSGVLSGYFTFFI